MSTFTPSPNPLNVTAQLHVGSFVDDETAHQITWLFAFVITPCISLFGIFGNTVTIFILRKHGLERSSNLLLFGLAVSDFVYLIGYNNVPKMIYDFGAVQGFTYSRSVSTMLFVLYEFFDILDWGGGYVSLTLPMLIAIERLVAVFLPLQFAQIVTTRKVVWSIGVVYFLFFAKMIYMRCWFTLTFIIDPRLNTTVGVIRKSQIYFDQRTEATILADLANVPLRNIPLAIVVLGCLAIGVKLRLTKMQRKKLAGGKSSSGSQNRTTRTLLAVCAVYTVTCLVSQLPSYIPDYMHYLAYSDKGGNLTDILYRAMNIVIAINSSTNFVIYVALNPRFKATYIDMFCQSRQQATHIDH